MEIVLATHNLDKCKELQKSFNNANIKVYTLQDFPKIGDIIEDGDTLEENAFIKSRTVYNLTKIPTVSDDTGLFVDALNGEPGIFSARYAGENATDEVRNQKLLHALKDIPYSQRTARFQCAIAIADKEGKIEVVEGVCQGEIAHQPKGDQGFGYDPVFVPDGYQQTFAQLGATVKNRISHRWRALALAAKVVQNWI